jgi:hypothetical protein
MTGNNKENSDQQAAILADFRWKSNRGAFLDTMQGECVEKMVG